MTQTVLVVDDHEPFRVAVGQLLRSAGYLVLGEASDGQSAILESLRLKPDYVLLDIQLPDISGFEVARQLANIPDPPAVLLISSRSASDYGSEVSRAPVCGFLAKHELSRSALKAQLRC